MVVRVRISNEKSFAFNDSRIRKVITASSKENAVKMGLWDRFKEFFRSEKKADALDALYQIVTADGQLHNGAEDQIKRFLRLKGFSADNRRAQFKIERTDACANSESTTGCTRFRLSIGNSVVATTDVKGFHEQAAVAEIIASYTNLDTKKAILACPKLGAGTYGVTYKHECPRKTWVYKIKNKDVIRGRAQDVCPIWNDVFSRLYGGRFQHLAEAEAIELLDTQPLGVLTPHESALKMPFVDGERPGDDYNREALDIALAEIGWRMPDNNKKNVLVVDGHFLPIDFDLLERHSLEPKPKGALLP